MSDAARGDEQAFLKERDQWPQGQHTVLLQSVGRPCLMPNEDSRLARDLWSQEMNNLRFPVCSSCLRRIVRCFVMALAMLTTEEMVCGQGPAERAPKPSEQAVAAAAVKVRDVFGDEILSAQSSEARIELARRLLGFADEAVDSTARYVLLETSRRLAIEACDVRLAMDSSREICESYDVNLLKLEIAALQNMARNGPSSSLGPVIDGLLEKTRQVMSIDWALAEELARAGAVAARKSRDRERGAAAIQVLAEVREAKKRDQQIKPLVDRLTVSPNDADAAYELGVIRCFEERDWAQGLPLLARGSDQALARIARLDLASVGDVNLTCGAGEAWTDYGKSQRSAAATAALERARFHYTEVLGKTKGLERARIEKLLEGVEDELSARGGVSRKTGPGSLPGIVLWLDASDPKGVQVTGGRTQRIGASVTALRDVSGGGYDAVAPTPGAAPKLVRFGASRFTAVDFDGVQSALVVRRHLPAKAFTGLTVIMVVDLPGPAAVKDREYPALVHNLQDPNGGFSIHFRGEQANRPLEFATWPLRDPTGYSVLSDGAKALEGPTIVVAVNNEKENVLYVSGQRVSKKENTGEVRVTDLTTFGARVDSAGGKLRGHFRGRIGEAILYSRALSEAEISPIVKSLQSKWAVP